MLNRLLLVSMVALGFSLRADAGLFRKSSKPDPAVHVPALLQILKSDKDERARASAAADLRDYDAKAFPEILPTLIGALATDPSSSVRSKAAESIGAVRPISPEAGHALETALEADKSFPVRISARTALFKYRVLGFIGAGKGELTVQTAEPPLAISSATKALPGGTILRPTPAPIPSTGPVMPPTELKTTSPPIPSGTQGMAPRPQSGEPPLAEPSKPAIPTPVLTSQPKAPAPVITIPSPNRGSINAIPTGPVLPTPRPLPIDGNKTGEKPATSSEQGPILAPPPGK